MLVYQDSESLKNYVFKIRKEGKTIGFVPTMGALHEGHLSLIKQAQNQTDCVVLSIFVNPTQFNNPVDLEKYPRTFEADLKLLESFKNIVVFHPSVDEIYGKNDEFIPIDLGVLDQVLEAKFRPGHFNGVVHVVHNLFKIVEPDLAFFGKKDFQQLAVIRKMVKMLNFSVQIIACDTLREQSGLAMSSRNLRLTETQKVDALTIYKTLKLLQVIKNDYTPEQAKNHALTYFNKGNLELEYLELIDGNTFQPLSDSWAELSVALIAAYSGEVRLIDNLEL